MVLNDTRRSGPDNAVGIVGDDGEIMPNLSVYGTPFDALKTAEQNIQFAIDPSRGLNKRRYAYFTDNTRYDPAGFTDNSRGTINVDTGGTGTDTRMIFSAMPGMYAAQAVAQPGVAGEVESSNVTVSDGLVSLNNGFVAFGAGRHNQSTGGWNVGGTIDRFIGLTLDTSGAAAVLIADGSHIYDSPVAQEDWNIDTLDGSGDSDTNPSGLEYHPEDGYVHNSAFSWYGYTNLYTGIVHPDKGRPVFVHRFSGSGVSLDNPSISPMLVVDENGDSTVIAAELGGMQYTLYGEDIKESSAGENRGTPVERQTPGGYVTDTVTRTNEAVNATATVGKPLIAVRRAGPGDLAVRSDEIVAKADNDAYVFAWDEYDDSGLTGGSWRAPHAPDGDESKIEVNTDCTGYTRNTAVFRGQPFVPGAQGSNEIIATLDDEDALPSDATRVYTAVNDGTNAQFLRFKERIIEGF